MISIFMLSYHLFKIFVYFLSFIFSLVLFFMSSICFTNVLVLFLYNLLLLIHIFHASISLYQYIINFSCVDTNIHCGWVYCLLYKFVVFHLWCHFPLFCDIRNLFSLEKMQITWNKDWNWDLQENLSVLPNT